MIVHTLSATVDAGLHCSLVSDLLSRNAFYMISRSHWDFRQVFRQKGDNIKRCHGAPLLFRRGLACNAYWANGKPWEAAVLQIYDGACTDAQGYGD